ncbi:sugar-binding protein [Paraliobacillus ryukyuensis]|uniref:sugar-binding protein n=1 Tax=Paraliobacillus ryukyuensis TaxID=200904 RepID=UPI0009A6B337|nr:sugar-binding protein [Paraliobacillus ryukyuensis]
MKLQRLVYSVLTITFFVSVGFSIYFFSQARASDARILKADTNNSPIPRYHFALIGEELEHDYWELVGQGAKDTEEEYEIAIEYEGPRRSNPEEQRKLLDMAIKSKVDGIIVQAVNNSFLPLINKAVDQGIPVITIDTDAAKSKRFTYIGTDNYEAGRLAGEELIEQTNGSATVGIVTGSFDNAHHQLRVQGFQDVIEQKSDISIVAIEESSITQVIAEEKAQNMLTKYPDLNALYGTSTHDATGMAEAAESLGRSNDLYIIGFDTLEENLQLLKQNKVDALIEQEPYAMGNRSIDLMMDIMENKEVKDVYHTDTSVVTKADLSVINE